MSWKENAIMFWSLDGNTWTKVTDHNRQPLDISFERFGNDRRMADGTLRRYSVAKKRTFSMSWMSVPSRNGATKDGRQGLNTVDGGIAGQDIEDFYNANDGRFFIKLRKGSDESKAISDGTIEVVSVMFTEYSRTTTKRGIVDYWDIDISLEEV